MNKKVRIYKPQYAQGGITQQDIQNYLMAQQQKQPQMSEDALVDIIYNELSLLGDKDGFIDQGYIDDVADKLTQTFGIDANYVANLVNEVYSTLAPSNLEYQNTKVQQALPKEVDQEDYQEDITEENLEENVASYDDYYGDDSDMSEMKYGGMSRKKFMKDFIKKAQEGMEQETDKSIMGNNDTLDGRNALIKGFESSVKKSVVNAVAKNQFDKMKQQNAYFAEGGFYDPNALGDDEAYAHHLNLIAATNKDIFNQPQLTMARNGREQRRANRDQRRVGRDVQKVLNNLPGLYPGGFNVYSMPGQIMPDMTQLGQGMPPFTIEGERNIFGGLKSYKASFEGGLPVNFMAGMMTPGKGKSLSMLSSIYGNPASYYSQQSYSNPGKIVYEEINKEALKEVDKNTPDNTSTEVKEEVAVNTPTTTSTTASTTTIPGPVVTENNTTPVVPKITTTTKSPVKPPIVPSIDRTKFKDDVEEQNKPGKNYKEWQTKEGGRAISYEDVYTTGMFGTKRPARYQIVYKPDGSIDKTKSFVAVSQSDYGGVIYVPWDKQGTFMYEEGGMIMNPTVDPFGNLQKFVYGGFDPSVAELDGTNLVDPSDPYTRKFANGGTQEEYQQYIDWYNESAPEEGMRRAAPQSYEEWMAENYPKTKVKQSVVPTYNPQNAALAAQYMSQALGLNRTMPMGTLARSINPFTINRQMVQKGLPMIAGTNIPFTAALGPDARISEIYTDPRRFGKDAVHVKFMVPGQEGPMLGMDWQQQLEAQKTTPKKEDKTAKETYKRSDVKGLEDESKVAIRAGERATKADLRRALRKDPNAFYEGAPLEGMVTPMSDEEYMARVNANRQAKNQQIIKNASLEQPYGYNLPYAEERYNTEGPMTDPMNYMMQALGKKSEYYDDPSNLRPQWESKRNIQNSWDSRGPVNPFVGPVNRDIEAYDPDYLQNNLGFGYGGSIKFPDGGFVYNNPVDNRTNPVMSDKDFFTANTNQNTIPDYLEWQSTPQQEVDVTYKQKNQLQFQPQALLPFVGSGAANLRGALEGNMIDKFNTQNAMSSEGREQADELVSQGMYDINTGKEINAGFEGIVGAGKGVGQQTYSKFGGQLNYEEGGEYDLTEEEIQALIDAGVDITLLEDYED